MQANFPDFVRSLLSEKDWSYEHLGGLIGVSHGAIGGWVRGTSLPEPKSLRALADLTGHDPKDLFVMVGYLPPEDEPDPMRPALTKIIRMLEPLDDLALEAIMTQIRTVLVPLIRKLEERYAKQGEDRQ